MKLKRSFFSWPLFLMLFGTASLSSTAMVNARSTSTVGNGAVILQNFVAASDNLYFGESYYADRQEYHSKIKKKILGAAGDYAKKVGSNPDIKVISKKIVLTGTGDFKGKSFVTELSADDYLQK
jgi:hypothetical protein